MTKSRERLLLRHNFKNGSFSDFPKNSFGFLLFPFLVQAVYAGRFIQPILVLSAAFVFTFSPIKADASDWLLENSLNSAGSCGSAFEGALSSGTSCLLDSGLNLMLKKSIESTDTFGKKVFGAHFQFFGDLSYQSGAGLQNDLDVVIPLAFTDEDQRKRSSLFLQQGITRWRDAEGESRDDLRIGVAYRFRLTDKPDSDVVGLSAFSLHNAEWGHQVLASRADYAGRWGTGSFTYFLPGTDWRPTDFGFEERALEGMELALNFKLTTTISTNLTAYRWQAEDGSDEWSDGARVGVDWRPHSWLSFSATQDGVGGGKDTSSFLAKVSIPIGGPTRPKPRWEGFGELPKNTIPSLLNLWRPVDKIGRIKVARRIRASDVARLVRIRPLQNTVVSGETLQARLSLPVAAPEDVRIMVRLAPGDGDNPVVPGEDFHDEIITATIRRGETSTLVSLPLIRNDEMTTPRGLKIVTVSQNSLSREYPSE